MAKEDNSVAEALVDKIKEIDITDITQDELIKSYKALKYIESLFHNMYSLSSYYDFVDIYFNEYKEWIKVVITLININKHLDEDVDEEDIKEWRESKDNESDS